MAVTKTASIQYQNINNATSPTAETYVASQVVINSTLVNNPRLQNPGVFTAGTTPEGYGNNLLDSNS